MTAAPRFAARGVSAVGVGVVVNIVG